MVIQIRDVTSGADTQDQGHAVYAELSRALAANDLVTLSFAGVDIATPSFINTCLMPLLDTMALEDLKRRLRVTNSTRQINDMIKLRLGRHASAAV